MYLIQYFYLPIWLDGRAHATEIIKTNLNKSWILIVTKNTDYSQGLAPEWYIIFAILETIISMISVIRQSNQKFFKFWLQKYILTTDFMYQFSIILSIILNLIIETNISEHCLYDQNTQASILFSKYNSYLLHY